MGYDDYPFLGHRELFISAIVAQIGICAIGYFGNFITCFVIVRNKGLRTTTNVYLLNLAFADIIMLSSGLITYTAPLMTYVVARERFSLSNCLLRCWIFQTAINVSVMTIMMFTIERYLAICHPFLARRIVSLSRTVKLTLANWIFGIIFGYMYSMQYVPKFYKKIRFCYWENAIPYFLEIQTLVVFVLPLIILIVLNILMWQKLAKSSEIQKCYGNTNVKDTSETENEKKIYKMLITVVAVFFVSWAPFHIGRYLKPIKPDNALQEGYTIIMINSIFYFTSASINPIIYSAMSNKFRDAFKDVIIKRCCICFYKKKAKVTEINVQTF